MRSDNNPLPEARHGGVLSPVYNNPFDAPAGTGPPTVDMSSAAGSPECGQLVQLQQMLDACLLRDIPDLRKQLQSLQRRCRDQQPVGRGAERLTAGIARSRQRVERRMAGTPTPVYPLALPVVERRESILAAIRDNPVVVLCGETGSGKTTQLPKICLELGRGTRGKIGHTQPRRIAARSLAARIAEELGSVLGEQVGYKVRFQDRVQDSSYVKVMTDGGPAGATTTMSVYIYNNAFRYYKMGYAAAIAWFLFLVIFIVTLVNWKYGGKVVHYE